MSYLDRLLLVVYLLILVVVTFLLLGAVIGWIDPSDRSSIVAVAWCSAFVVVTLLLEAFRDQ